MKRSPDRKAAAAILFTILAVVTGLVSFASLPAPVDKKLHAEIGGALATEAAGLLRPGGKITVISRDTETFPQPALDILLKNFTRHIGKETPVATLLIQVDPLRPASVPPGDFFELLRKSKPEDVIISLLGPPMLSDQQRLVLGGVRPKIVALCSGAMAGNLDLRTLFDAGLVHAAVVGRTFTVATTEAARRVPRNFETLYQTYTSKELATLPVSAARALFNSD